LVGESASFRVYDAQLANGNLQISHVHAAPAVAILIKGRVLSQGPENKDKTIGEVASGLKQLDRPGQWVFVPAGEAHYVVRLGIDRTHIVEVELR
jgi:quercetin dioxygenase-like cupin family protein